MVNLLYNLLMMTISGTILFLLSLLFSGHKRYAWIRYAMLTAAVLMMLVPVQAVIRVPKVVSVAVPERVYTSAGHTVQPTGGRAVISLVLIIAAVWAAGMAVSAVRFAVRYCRSARILGRISEKSDNEKLLGALDKYRRRLGIKRHIRLRTSSCLNSPMLFGLLRPVVIIPEREFRKKELEMILLHELTHYKHRDLWISFAASAAQCIHWFNPAVYFIGNAIVTAREHCCDETVLEKLEPESKKDYGRLIISVIEDGLNSQPAYTTAMAAAGISIQKRLKKIVEFRPRSRVFKLACMMLVCSCAVSSLTAFGFEKAAEIIPEEIKEELEKPIDLEKAGEVVIGSILPESDEAEPVETEAEVTETAVPEEEETEAPPEPETPQEEPEVYMFADTAEEADAAAEQTAEPQPEELKTIALPESSYVFKPDFDSGTAVRSDNFYVPEGVSVTVQEYAAADSDLRVEVYDALTDELFIDGTGGSRRLFSFMRGGTYYIIAYCTTGDCDGIYVSGKNIYSR